MFASAVRSDLATLRLRSETRECKRARLKLDPSYSCTVVASSWTPNSQIAVVVPLYLRPTVRLTPRRPHHRVWNPVRMEEGKSHIPFQWIIAPITRKWETSKLIIIRFPTAGLAAVCSPFPGSHHQRRKMEKISTCPVCFITIFLRIPTTASLKKNGSIMEHHYWLVLMKKEIGGKLLIVRLGFSWIKRRTH